MKLKFLNDKIGVIACVGVEETEVDSRYGTSFMKKKTARKSSGNIGEELRFEHILSSDVCGTYRWRCPVIRYEYEDPRCGREKRFAS